MVDQTEPHPNLLSRQGFRWLAALTLLIALLMAVAALLGLLHPSELYTSEDLRQSLVPTDVVNLVIGLPILLGSVWLAWRGQWVGLLLWPGALLFVLYNYLAYLFAMPFNVAFLLHLALVTLSAYTIIGLVATIDRQAVQRALAGAVPERLAGGILAALGLLFSLRVIAVLLNAVISQSPLAGSELAPSVADSLIAPALIIGGVLLWRRQALGYVAGLGLLFQASMLFIGLAVLLLLRPLLTDAPFALLDVVVVLALGLICFVPLALYARGVRSGRQPPPE